MIVEWFLAVATLLLRGVLALLGDIAAPGWLTSAAGQLDSLVASVASLGVWIPWGVVGPAMAAVIACAGISFVVRLGRMAVSLFTGGGGSAA